MRANASEHDPSGPIQLCARMKKLVKTELQSMTPGELFAACTGSKPSEDAWLADTAYVLDSELAKLALRLACNVGAAHPSHHHPPPPPPLPLPPPSLAQQGDALRGRTTSVVQRSTPADDGSTTNSYDPSSSQPAVAAARGIDVLDQLERTHHDADPSLGGSRLTPGGDPPSWDEVSPRDASAVVLPASRPTSATLSWSHGHRRRDSGGSWNRFVTRLNPRFSSGRNGAGPAEGPRHAPPVPVAVERVVDDRSRGLIWWY